MVYIFTKFDMLLGIFVYYDYMGIYELQHVRNFGYGYLHYQHPVIEVLSLTENKLY